MLSDLFGPYLIGKERLEEGLHSADEQEIMTEQKKGGKNKRSIRHAGLADQFKAKMGKKKKNAVDTCTSALVTGMSVLPGEEQRWEVWLHEQCAIWAAGVYMAGELKKKMKTYSESFLDLRKIFQECVINSYRLQEEE